MKAILIFDSVNDLFFSKWDESFLNRMKLFNGQVSRTLSFISNTILAVLSPLTVLANYNSEIIYKIIRFVRGGKS